MHFQNVGICENRDVRYWSEINQSRDQYAQLEARVKEQEAMICEYQTRGEYAELKAKDIKAGGDDYWFTRLRDAARRFQEHDKTNEKIMNLARDVAEHVTTIAREAMILLPRVVSREMKSSLEMLFDQIDDLGIRVKPYLSRN
ncbi:hypothetical protein GQ457_17G008490 [Hibiscus cannabinus]